MNGTPRSDRRDDRNSTGAIHAVSPIIKSAVGVVRESAGLLCNIAALGLALGFEAPKQAPRRPIRPTSNAVSNVIPFPATRAATRKK